MTSFEFRSATNDVGPSDEVGGDGELELDDHSPRLPFPGSPTFTEWFVLSVLPACSTLEMPRRREKFVEITKTVTVTEIVNGPPDKHPRTCQVKVTNLAPADSATPHPVNVSIKHMHEKWRSSDGLNDDGDVDEDSRLSDRRRSHGTLIHGQLGTLRGRVLSELSTSQTLSRALSCQDPFFDGSSQP
ncbi:unnamed protein product [Caenorhabditis auriculariae]|uniref:Uncharacterized protein n=1 Tax=Caenorhabditis auriculariae TaxID=2777116 RepID=A0A8S1HRG2_9PELO|nr:unnamed protein product [Caenorhabditis auriculariae]